MVVFLGKEIVYKTLATMTGDQIEGPENGFNGDERL